MKWTTTWTSLQTSVGAAARRHVVVVMGKQSWIHQINRLSDIQAISDPCPRSMSKLTETSMFRCQETQLLILYYLGGMLGRKQDSRVSDDRAPVRLGWSWLPPGHECQLIATTLVSSWDTSSRAHHPIHFHLTSHGKEDHVPKDRNGMWRQNKTCL